MNGAETTIDLAEPEEDVKIGKPKFADFAANTLRRHAQGLVEALTQKTSGGRRVE